MAAKKTKWPLKICENGQFCGGQNSEVITDIKKKNFLLDSVIRYLKTLRPFFLYLHYL